MENGKAAAAGEKFGLTGYALKWIAIVTMFIDHAAAVVIARQLNVWQTQFGNYTHAEYVLWYRIYVVMRCIGRMAFPIFCFLLTEGFLHTRNVWKYALRMGIFALVTEVPFDMAFQQSYWDLSYNNVMFTLMFGLLTLALIRVFQKKLLTDQPKWFLRFCGRLLIAAAICAGVAVAELCNVDYGGVGVLVIVILYLLRNHRLIAFGTAVAVMGIFLGEIEFLALLMLIPLCLYNGKRGNGSKYFFYVFYPLHLLILSLVCISCGI